ncbi:MAG: HAD family phosphatase [Erysipelotrichaceae bacterium]|nr:HAD family phosphatase [Erysipelotrichaceae bacterium]
MIKNIIFDMGNVLVKYDPDFILDSHGVNDPEDRKLLLDNISYSEGWKKMDLGIYEEEDLYNEAIMKLPERLHPKAREILNSWYKSLIPVEGMEELIRRLKDHGFGIYLLSNAGRSKDIYWKDIPGNQYFDGTVVSAFERCIKPDKKIYKILLGRYGLKAEECLFIDDMETNVIGAEKAGIKAYEFDGDMKKLEKYIDDIIQQKEKERC